MFANGFIFQSAVAGAVGLKASIKELLAWGVAHIPNNGKALNGSEELAEAIRVATQVERGKIILLLGLI